jgi:FlaA1/EpsC-like NDP-sugar epimerase
MRVLRCPHFRPSSFFAVTIPRSIKKVGRFPALVLAYSAVITASLWLALEFRFDFEVEQRFVDRFVVSLPWMLGLKLLLLAAFGQFRSLLTYFGPADAIKLAWAMGLSAVVSLGVWFAVHGFMVVPRGVIVSDAVLSFLGLVGLRMAMRVYREKLTARRNQRPGGVRRRTMIIGAGDAGELLLRDIQTKPGLGLDVVCFVDDDPAKIGGTLHGKPVVGPLNELGALARQAAIRKVIIAMPSAPPAVIKEVVRDINQLGLDHDILPSVSQMLHRQVTVSHLRRVDPEDLLGRAAVPLDEQGIGEMIRGEAVLVTGAGGSIGSELCRQIAEVGPAKLLLVERSEPALFAIEQELRGRFPALEIQALAHDVRDEPFMHVIFDACAPTHVFHAAAHKHVPLMEAQPAEAISNNALGTEVMCRLARAHGCRKFTLVSTDKAVNPTNVMGASKRMAELVVEEYQRNGSNGCAFAAVRFGNVLGSSGSVIPTFRRQIADGGPVTVTHPEVTRFFMSIPEAVGLILQCSWQARGGERFVLDMGEPIKIADLARQMIELSGFVPDRDIEIAFIGLRPGEKLYEEPIHEMEDVETTSHPKVRCLRRNGQDGRVAILEHLRDCRETLVRMPHDEIRTWMKRFVPEFVPAHHK